MNEFPRETNEPQPFTVTVNDRPVTDPTQVQIATTTNRARPTSWSAPVLLDDGRLAIPVNGLLPGVVTAWAKPTDTPWAPVIELGQFRVS